MAAFLCQGLFDRFPNVRVAVIESGTGWVPSLVKKLKKALWPEPDGVRVGPDREAARARLGGAVL